MLRVSTTLSEFWQGWTCSIACIMLMLGVWAGGTPDLLTAQSRGTYSEHTHRVQQRPSERGGRGESGLPAWAEPSHSSSRHAETGRRPGLGGGMQTNVPGDEPTVPVDGGVVWLALLGVGYAVSRLYGGSFSFGAVGRALTAKRS